MPDIQVDEARPVLLQPTPFQPLTVKNLGPGTVMFLSVTAGNENITEVNKTGQLGEGSSEIFTVPTLFIRKPVATPTKITEGEKPNISCTLHPTYSSFDQVVLPPESVPTAALQAGAVSAAKTAADVYPPRLLFEQSGDIKESLAESGAGEAYLVDITGVPALSASKKVVFPASTAGSIMNTQQPGKALPAGKTVTATTYVDIVTGKGVSPTITFGFFEVASIGEATAKATEVVWSGVIKGSCAFTTPAAKVIQVKESSTFVPGVGVTYVFGYTTSGPTVAESNVSWRAQLYLTVA